MNTMNTPFLKEAPYVIAFFLIAIFVGWDTARLNKSKVEVNAQEVQITPTISITPTITTTPTPMPTEAIKRSDNPIEDYIIEIFGEEDGLKGIKMLKECENGSLNPKAVNDKNSNGTWDAGLFQINQIHGYTQEQLFDYKFNTRAAYKIYKASKNSFYQWSCSHIIGEIPFYLR